MTEPVLYSFRRCPYAMRARMALDAAEISWEHREILLRDKPEEMLAASPKGTVPVLVTPTGDVIDESLDIMEWALAQSDPEDWADEGKQDRRDVEAFLEVFKPALDRYKYASRYDSSVPRGAVDLDQRKIAMDALIAFSQTLSKTSNLRRQSPRLIDIASFPFVRQFAAVEPDWWASEAPKQLQQWLQGHLESPRFKRIMKKHELWKSLRRQG